MASANVLYCVLTMAAFCQPCMAAPMEPTKYRGGECAGCHGHAQKLGSSLNRVGKGLPGRQREVEFAGNEVGDIEEVVGGSIASGLGLGGLDQGVDAFHEAIA